MTDTGTTTASGQQNPPPNYGDSPYTHKSGTPKFKRLPWCVYFYYIGEKVGNSRPVRHYSYQKAGGPITQAEMPNIIRRLAINAVRSDEEQYPWPDGGNWENIVWKRRSYFVVLLDDPTVKFVKNNALILTNEGNPNVTFYDAKDDEIDVDKTGLQPRKVTYLYCINHLKKSSGGSDLEGKLDYRFYLNAEPSLGPRTRYPESGGQNEGPGVPP
jgi:hypothetical protein